MAPMAAKADQSNGCQADGDFLRRLTFPEEELRSLTTAPWSGERRWFRSPNVVPMEWYRSPDQVSHILSVLHQRRRGF
jgi:hypothetical protein